MQHLTIGLKASLTLVAGRRICLLQVAADSQQSLNGPLIPPHSYTSGFYLLGSPILVDPQQNQQLVASNMQIATGYNQAEGKV